VTGKVVPASVAETPVASGLARRLWESLPGLLAANLVFLAWCAPYALLALLGFPALALAVLPVTVGPGAAGLVTAAARMVRRDGPGADRPGLDGRRLRAGALLAAALVLAWQAQLAALGAVVAHEGSVATLVLWAAELALLLVAAMVGVHALPLVGLHGQGALEATRNGFVLAARHPGPTATTLAGVVSAGVLAWYLAGAPLIILPAALALFAVSSTDRLSRDGGATT
jgi:hypothetical protein